MGDDQDLPVESRYGLAAGNTRRLGWAVGLVVALGVVSWAQLVRFEPRAAASMEPTRRRVLLLTIDTLRADHVAAAPYGPKNTPVLESLLNDPVFPDP